MAGTLKHAPRHLLRLENTPAKPRNLLRLCRLRESDFLRLPLEFQVFEEND